MAPKTRNAARLAHLCALSAALALLAGCASTYGGARSAAANRPAGKHTTASRVSIDPADRPPARTGEDTDLRLGRDPRESDDGRPDGVAVARPPAGGQARPRTDREAEAAIKRKLGRIIPKIIWPNIPWRDAIDDIAEQSGIQILTNWAALEGEGLGPDRKVRTEARDISVGEALDLLSDLVGAGDGPSSRVAYFINGNVLMVTTASRARGR